MKQTSDMRVNLSLYIMDAELIRDTLASSFALGWLRQPESDDDDAQRNTRRLIATLDERIAKAKRRHAERKARD